MTIIHNAVLSFPHLFQKHKATATAEPKFSCQLLVRPDNPAVQQIHQAAREAAIEKFGPEMGPRMPSPLKTGEDINHARALKGKPPRPELAGLLAITASESVCLRLAMSDGRSCLNTDTDPASVQLLGELKAKLRAGVIVNAIFDIYAFKVPANQGVTAGLRGVQFVTDTGPGVMDLGGATPLAADAFASVEAPPVDGASLM